MHYASAILFPSQMILFRSAQENTTELGFMVYRCWTLLCKIPRSCPRSTHAFSSAIPVLLVSSRSPVLFMTAQQTHSWKPSDWRHPSPAYYPISITIDGASGIVSYWIKFFFGHTCTFIQIGEKDTVRKKQHVQVLFFLLYHVDYGNICNFISLFTSLGSKIA